MIKEVMKICGLAYDKIEERLLPFANEGVLFEIRESCLDATVTLSSELTSAEFDKVRSNVFQAFRDEIYSSFDISLAQAAANQLKLNGRTLAVAESLTGGLVSSMLTDIPGISEVFFEGIVCYNKLSKTERLGVSTETLATEGAISRQTAFEMVRGLCVSPVDIGLSTTGLAGPDPDEGKPVGLVYIGVGAGDYIRVFEHRLSGSRATIRQATANLALGYLVHYLRGELLLKG